MGKSDERVSSVEKANFTPSYSVIFSQFLSSFTSVAGISFVSFPHLNVQWMSKVKILRVNIFALRAVKWFIRPWFSKAFLVWNFVNFLHFFNSTENWKFNRFGFIFLLRNSISMKLNYKFWAWLKNWFVQNFFKVERRKMFQRLNI